MYSLDLMVEEAKIRLDTGIKKPIPRNPRWQDGNLSDENDREVAALTESLCRIEPSSKPKVPARKAGVNGNTSLVPSGHVPNMKEKFQPKNPFGSRLEGDYVEFPERNSPKPISSFKPYVGASNSRRESNGMDARLPKLELASFDGRPTDFEFFMQSFEAAVDSKPLSNIAKMQYLLSMLTGAAKNSIAGYPVTNDSYPEVMATLKRRFGDPEVIIRHLHKELQDTHTSQDSVAANRKTLERIERICRQLEMYDESTDHQQVRMVVEQKFSRWVLIELYKIKTKNEKIDQRYKWSTSELRKAADELLTMREKVDNVQVQAVRDSEPKKFGKPQKFGKIFEKPNKGKYTQSYSYKKREDYIPTAAFGLVKRNDPNIKCAFCQEKHKPGICYRYKTPEARLKRAQELELCFICLKISHMARECPTQRKCLGCGKPHHRLLCYSQKDGAKAWPGSPAPKEGNWRQEGSTAPKNFF